MRRIKCLSFIFLIFCSAAFGQTGEFTYQGRLVDGSLAASGTYEMRFRLFDTETDGTQQPQPTPITLDFTVANGNPVTVTNGVFTVKLNFNSAAFPGAARWLEIYVRRTAADPFTLLNPRQPITSAPHNIKSLSSDGLSVACVLCVTDAQIQSIDGGKVTGTVANATTAVNVSGIVPISNGGTGSSTKNFVDLSTNQNVSGNKIFNNAATFNGAVTVAGSNNTLTVDGSLNVDFNVTADQFFGDGANLTNIIPTGAVMFFQLAACPSGWTELVEARGRYLVGLPSGGTLGATQGTALSNLEDRPTGQHGHSTSHDFGHSHTTHGHFANVTVQLGSTRDVAGATAGIANTSNTTISINPSGNVAGTNAPYLQLLVCKKD